MYRCENVGAGTCMNVCGCVLLCAITRTCIVNSLKLAMPLSDLDEPGSKISNLVIHFFVCFMKEYADILNFSYVTFPDNGYIGRNTFPHFSYSKKTTHMLNETGADLDNELPQCNW